MIDFTGKKVIIFGGGAVGARKARYFMDEAEVLVYSRSFHADLLDLPVFKQEMTLVRDISPICSLIRDSELVIAATSDPEINASIRDACRKEGILCNVAAGPAGDVVLPAKICGKRYTIGISTHGSVPAVSRLIREQVEELLPNPDALIDLGDWIRSEFRNTNAGYDRILHDALRDPRTHAELSAGLDQAKRYVREQYAT
ncbi:MAG: bifunctional precorrin-2 dehydrogenase/sirohydrochlorin ferrochelatase [Methanospirillum sp.]|nr:bifunctional precorrin-2 dehydrogenase/sirohydrochlorin ferrochelatase [Methanospirillum sp.]